MRLPSMRAPFVLCTLAATTTAAADQNLAPLVAVSEVTATSASPGKGPERALMTFAPADKGQWCTAGAAKDAPEALTVVFAAPVEVDEIRLPLRDAAHVRLLADGEPLPAHLLGGKFGAKPARPVTKLTLLVPPGPRVCVGPLTLERDRKAVVPLLGADEAALAALPDALVAFGKALDTCDAAVFADAFDFPFVYENAQRGSIFRYKSAKELTKTCTTWRARTGHVDLDIATAPIPDAIYKRWSDMTLYSDAAGRLSIAVSYSKRTQWWRLAWRDARWHLVAVDT